MEIYKNEKIEVSSTDVQDVLGGHLPKVVRFGMIWLFIILTGIIGIGFFIDYPDVIDGQAILILNQENIIISKTIEIDTILVSNNSYVKENDWIIISKSQTRKDHILLVKDYLDTLNTLFNAELIELKKIPIIEGNLNLGSLSSSFNKFRDDFNIILSKNTNRVLKVKPRITNQDSDNDVLNKLLLNIHKFQTSFDGWVHDNVITAGTDGFLNFTKKIQTRRLNKGDLALSIVDTSLHSQYTLNIIIPSVNSGKVKRGQKVIITFENYPSNEFGFIYATIDCIILDESANMSANQITTSPRRGENFKVVASLDNALISNTGDTLHYIPDMKGQANVILKRISFVEQLFKPIENILDKSK